MMQSWMLRVIKEAVWEVVQHILFFERRQFLLYGGVGVVGVGNGGQG